MNKVYSGLASIPKGSSPDTVTPGCLVLEGGAFRAVYGEGVLDRLLEDGINFGCAVGVSAGALNGFNYISGQIGRAARINLSQRYNSRYVGLKAMKENHGIIGFKYAFSGDMNGVEAFDFDRFYDPRRRFVAVCTNLANGKAEYFEKGQCQDIFQAIRASASMPYLSKPVTVDGIPCLDGGVRVKIPYRWALDEGYEKVVVVETKPRGMRRNESSPEARCAKFFYRSRPEFAQALSTSLVRANQEEEELERLTDSGRVFTVWPSKDMQVDRIERDLDKLGDWYWLGYNDMAGRLGELRDYLGI